MYRDRLIRAYLGASNPNRKAKQFTGFCDSDNIQMHDINVNLRPFHVVNMTLNLVGGDRLAWQQRQSRVDVVPRPRCTLRKRAPGIQGIGRLRREGTEFHWEPPSPFSGRSRQSEHGLSFFVRCRFHPDTVQSAVGSLVGKSG